MPRKPSKTVTDRELEIMEIIRELGEASGKDTQDRLPGDRHYNSVLTIIRVLERKRHLVHRAEGRTHYYRASESREKALQSVLHYMVRQVFGGSAASIVLNLVETGDLTKKDLDEIRQQITRRKVETQE